MTEPAGDRQPSLSAEIDHRPGASHFGKYVCRGEA
jgi:hypothetical protein